MKAPAVSHGNAGSRHLLLFIPAALLASLYVAWQLSAALNFFYPVWYQALDIDDHIAHFGPQNRYRKGFELTTDEERFRLFADIVDSVQGGGAGLETLEYHDASGRRLGGLFRPPEIVHLQDVAKLTATLKPWGWAAVVWILIHGYLIRRRGWRVPGPSRMLALTLAGFVAGTAVILLAGAKRVFYALHELVFPDDHQWFFYYQDSLMSTMMKAPDLFAAIAGQLAVFTIVVFWCISVMAARLATAGGGVIQAPAR